MNLHNFDAISLGKHPISNLLTIQRLCRLRRTFVVPSWDCVVVSPWSNLSCGPNPVFKPLVNDWAINHIPPLLSRNKQTRNALSYAVRAATERISRTCTQHMHLISYSCPFSKIYSHLSKPAWVALASATSCSVSGSKVKSNGSGAYFPVSS